MRVELTTTSGKKLLVLAQMKQCVEGEHYAALRLGFNFAMLRNYFEGQLIKPPAVMESLDLAMEVLFGYSEFYYASFNLFIRLTEGKLTREEEQMLNALGIKTF